MNRITVFVGALSVAWALKAPAQQAPTIPIREVTPAIASDSGAVSSIMGFRALSNGYSLVNDPSQRRILMFDPTLKHFKVLSDTSANAKARYGTLSAYLTPYLGDSTIVVDQSATALLVIDPSGAFGNVMSPPKASDIYYMGTPGSGFDPKGRIVYRGYRRSPPNPNAVAAAPVANGAVGPMTASPDSAPILRGDFDTRTVDTIALFHVHPMKSGMQMLSAANGSRIGMGVAAQTPLPQNDEWTLLPDGTIAIVRAQDYHIDWLGLDGKMTATPKMTFDWKRITEEEKVQIIDSVKKSFDAMPEQSRYLTMSDGTKFPRTFMTVEPKELPDYYPPVRAGQVRADPEGNVWILPSTSSLARGGLLFDVVNRKGEVFERVQLPPNRNLIGIGPGGVLYLSPPAAPFGSTVQVDMRLERVQVIRPNAAPIKQ